MNTPAMFLIFLLYVYGLYQLLPNVYTCIEYPNVVIPHNYLIYDGDLNINIKDGVGTLYFIDGSIYYKGQFRNDKFNGIGTMYNFDRTVYYEGVWFEGRKLKNHDFRTNNEIYSSTYDSSKLDFCVWHAHFNYLNTNSTYNFTQIF